MVMKMRARNIKPGFFKNEDLADCDLSARLLFIGLWCMADREGRLEYRPKRIKAEVLPYDACNVEKLLNQLHLKKFIIIYTVTNEKYIQILNFRKHQNCHIKEAASTIPAPCEHDTSIEVAQLNPESLLLNPESPLLKEEASAEKPRSSPIKKIKYLDSVYLTEQEHAKLREVLGQNLDNGIEQLDYSITVKAGKYKDHYKTLLNWHKRGFINASTPGHTTNFRDAKRPAIYAEQERLADEINAEYYRRKAIEAANQSRGNT